MRGSTSAPKLLPAIDCATLSQVELWSSLTPSRSHGNCTLMRPYWSVQISSPLGPTTSAVSQPTARGRAVCTGARNGTVAGNASKELVYSSSRAVWCTRRSTKAAFSEVTKCSDRVNLPPARNG